MKRLLIVLAVLTAACGGGAAATTTTSTTPTTLPQSDLLTYTSQDLGFSIEYPATWVVSEDIKGGIVSFTNNPSQPGPAGTMNVVVGTIPAQIFPLDYYANEIERMKRALPDLQVLEDTQLAIQGLPARAISGTAVQGGVQVALARIIVLRERRAYEITFLTTGSTMGNEEAMVRQLLQSFRFTAP